MEIEETNASTVDGEIKKILMTEKKKMNIKEIKNFILQNFIEKDIKKILLLINTCCFYGLLTK